MSNREAFNDVQELRNASLGILGGEGATHLEAVKTECTPQGIDSTCTCGSCSKPNIITVGYDEAVIGGLRYLPPGWVAEAQTNSMFPNIGCASCRYQLKLLFTDSELRGYLDRAVRDGYITMQQIQQIKADVAARAPQAPQRR